MPIKNLYYYNGQWQVSQEDYLPTDYKTDYPTTKQVAAGIVYNPKTGKYEAAYKTVKDPDNISLNKINKQKNEDNAAANDKLAKKNAVYTKILETASAAQKAGAGSYLSQKNTLQSLKDQANQAGISDTQFNDAFESYNDFYKKEIVGSGWSIDLGAKPPAGGFDPKYYVGENPAVQATWEQAEKQGDLDILAQYKSPEIFALYNYTTVGKPSGKRGNKAEELLASKEYLEKKPTDSDIAGIKDQQLGIGYEAVKETKPGTKLEEAVSEAIGADAIKKTKQFGALTQDVLKNTISEMQKAKAKEQMLSMMGGLPGFQEILNINQTLSNSILGDSGVGGILAFSGAEGNKAQESLEKSLQNMTGVNTSSIYNWQQWFDTSLKKQYKQDLELGLTKKDAEEKIQVEADFAKKFIEQYLIPRFNESKTVSEFIEYVNVKDEEQNPFQTQDMVNAAVDAASLKSQAYLDQLKQLQDAYFDPKFYFDPNANLKSEQAKSLAGATQQQANYKLQAETVAKDWEEAKKQVNAQNGDWFEQAYKYGVDVNDKDAFAKLHFQVQGQFKGFDAAEDLWTTAKVQDYIYTTILPAVKSETDKMTVFGNFIKPDEFADNLLSNYNVKPDDKSTWSKVLDTFKLKKFQGSYDELKSYIADTFKTVSAVELQPQLKELKKKGIKPTQKNLGVFYIEKPTDTAGAAEGETALYKAFKGAGYGGTEDDFYQNFFPDLDIEEQKILTQAGSKSGGLKFIEFDTKDPFAALGTVEKLTGGDKGEFSNIFSVPTADDETDTKKDFFNLGLDDEKDYKSKTGASILGEFTSFLKGF